MADNTSDAFNGIDAQMHAMVEDLDELCKELYYELAQALGYDIEDIKSGKITHEDIVKYARACDTGDFY